jgi:hypothetical protein
MPELNYCKGFISATLTKNLVQTQKSTIRPFFAYVK